MLSVKAVREELKKLCDGKVSNIDMLCELFEQHCPPVARFFNWCLRIYERSDLFPTPVWKFFRCIASVSPVCSYFPPDGVFLDVLAEIMAGLDIRTQPEKLLTLQRAAPILFNLLTALPVGNIPDELKTLFEAMADKLKLTFAKGSHYLDPVETNDASASNEISFLPNWPQRNQRGLYKQDLLKSGQNRLQHDCTKDYRGHPRLMPGIFTLYCKHGML